MIKATQQFFILILLFSFSACEFSSTETYKVDLEQIIDPENIEIIELSLDDDTLFVYQVTEINFEFDTDTNDIIWIDVEMDNEIIHSTPYRSGSFILNPYQFDEGEHSLSIKVYTETNSGSIADNLGYEAFIFQSPQWTLYSCKQSSNLLPFNDTTINSRYIIDWGSPEYSSDFYYLIKKHLGSKNGHVEYELTTSNGSFVDVSYLGEEAYYQIFLVYRKTGINCMIGYIEKNEDFADLSLRLIEDKPMIHWALKPYYVNLSKYSLFDYTNDISVSLLAPTDTSCILPNDLYPLGSTAKISLVPVPRRPSQYYVDNRDSIFPSYNLLIGNSAQRTKNMTYASNLNTILYQNGSDILLYDISSGNVSSLKETFGFESTNYEYSIYLSPLREYACIFDYKSKRLFHGRIDKLESLQLYNTKDKRRFSDILVSDQNDMLFLDSDSIFLFSKEANRITSVKKYNSAGISDKHEKNLLSIDGDYYITYNNYWYEIYKRNGISFSHIRKEELRNKYPDCQILQHPTRNYLIYILYQNKVLVRYAESFQYNSDYTVANGENACIGALDIPNNRFLSLNTENNTLKAHQLDNGRILYSNKIIDVSDLSTFSLIDKTVYSSIGFSFELPL